MDLKKLLKTIKLHQEELSIVLGIILLVAAGIFIIRYIRNIRTAQTTTTETQQTQNQTHTVSKGESLWNIAQKYYNDGNKWKVIADANNIKSPSKIEVGQNLIIPDAKAASPTAIATTSSEISSPTPAPMQTTLPTPSPQPQITDKSASTTSEIKENKYTVVKGDNLWNIAVRAYGDGTQWHKIAQVNNLKNPRIIHSGNVFSIPR